MESQGGLRHFNSPRFEHGHSRQDLGIPHFGSSLWFYWFIATNRNCIMRWRMAFGSRATAPPVIDSRKSSVCRLCTSIFFLESDSPERGLSRTLRSQPPPKFPPQGPGPRPRIAKETFEMVNEDRGKRSRGKTIAKEVLQEAPSASLTFSTPADVAGKCVFPEGNANRSGVARGGKRTGEPIAEAAPKRPTIEREPKDNQSEVGKKKEELK